MRFLLLYIIFCNFVLASDFRKLQNVVVDKKENIMWQDNLEVTQYPEGIIMAKTYCENLILNGYTDWKIPSIKQLQSIVEIRKKDIAIKQEFTFSLGEKYISDTKFIINDLKYWYVDFKTGKTFYGDKDKKYFIRCIREIK